MKQLSLLFTFVISLSWPLHAADLSEHLAKLKAVGPEGKGNSEAAAAWSEITSGPAASIVTILEAMDGSSPLSMNWMRSAAEAILEKEKVSGSELPSDELQAFLLNRENDPKARYLAYDFLVEIAPEDTSSLVPDMIDDPSPPLRRVAVAELIAQGRSQLSTSDQAATTLQAALDAARDVDQINEIAKLLREDLEKSVDLPTQFGFLMRWHLIAPFDNTDREGFDHVYPPEENVDLNAAYEGKDGKEVRWETYATSDDYGMVDFNQPFSPLKEVTGYAYTEFQSDGEQEVELRLGCKNAWKIWLNGKLLFGRDEYHRGIRIDQYTLPVTLKPGRNTLLVKACQNEQEQDWTVQWEFQLRVCDSTGAAVLSTDRQPTPKPEEKARRRSAE
ncbi:MAG: hypothetical protein P1U58_15480 [Verrucomicrobiales bacterium]|nr:hypothetical protein [Verrucomicrobiales bacterium]